MITFATGYEEIGFDSSGSVDRVPVNSYLQSVQFNYAGRGRNHIIITDTSGNWGSISYQNTDFGSNIELYNYLYFYTQINKVVTKKIEICKADLKTSNSIPIELVAAPGIGLIILPHTLAYNYKYLSTQYDFAQNLYVHCLSKTDANPFFEINKGIINAAANRSAILTAPGVAGISSVNAFAENYSIIFKAKTSDATVGDGYLVLYITYSIVEESWYDGVYCT